MSDLRAFLDAVRKARPADVVEVEQEFDPRYETAAAITKLEQQGRSPILVFNRIRGCERPVVTNVCGSMGRLALALGCPLKDVARVYGERARSRVLPHIVSAREAPCQEVVLRGAEVDLGQLPALVYHADDANEPYITAAIVVARDPETGKSNLSYHRLMIAGRARTGILMEKGRHLDGIFRKYVARGRDMPIAVFIGAHPLWSLGALYSGSADVEEYDVIGGLLGEPLRLVRTILHDELAVPAATELVLEGVVTHTERMREGPFGEFTGYGTGIVQTPVFEVGAMTYRRDFWFQDIVSGRMEHLVLSMPAIEHRTLEVARTTCPGVQRIALVAPLTTVVALDKRNDDEPRRLIDALLRSDIYSKQVIVVDADVDPADLRSVLSAMALHSQADQHVTILQGELGTPLDPSCDDPEGKTAKLGIDATRKLAVARSVTRNRLPQHVLDRIDVQALIRRSTT